MMRYLGPYQTVCDYWNYWWTFLSEHISQPTTYGFSQRALLNLADPGHQLRPAARRHRARQRREPAPTAPLGIFGGQQYLHGPAYGAAIDNQGNADCEVGQRGYPKKLNYFDPQQPQLRHRPAHPGRPGPDLQGPRPRPRRRDVHPRPARPAPH